MIKKTAEREKTSNEKEEKCLKRKKTLGRMDWIMRKESKRDED